MGLGKSQEPRRGCRPAVESLEGRTVLTVYKAASVAQLLADIQLASTSSGDTIRLVQGNYHLSGEILIQNPRNLTIEGNPNLPNSVRITGGNGSRVFEVNGGSMTFSGLTISGGSGVTQGGGIRAENANVTISKTDVQQNTATQGGGGVFVQGSKLDVEQSSINGNNAGGGVSNYGGGIAAFDSQVMIHNSTVNNNATDSYALNTTAPVIANGAGIFAQSSVLTLKSSTASHNTAFASTNGPRAAASGGAIATSASNVTVLGSTIDTNNVDTITSGTPSAQGSSFSTIGGLVTITNSTLTGNAPGHDLLFNTVGATVVVKNSTINAKKIVGSYTLVDSGS